MPDLTGYTIDIAARMTGQETFAELDQLTATLAGSGKGAEHFGRAIQTLSGQLSAAAAANASAQEQLVSGQARYRELEVALDRATKAAERAGKKHGGIVPVEDYAAVVAAQAALDAHSSKLAAVERAATATAAAEKSLAGQLQNVRTAAAHVDRSLSLDAERLSLLQSGLSSSGSWAGRLASSLLGPVKGYTDLTQTVGKSNAVMLIGASVAVGVATAFAAIVAAAGAAAAAITLVAVKLADTQRNLGLAREGAEALHPELAALRGDISAIGDSTGMAEDKLRGLAGQLKAAKVSAADMPAALRAMATAEAAVEGGGAAFVKQIKKGNAAVSTLAATTQAKFGGIVERKMLSLDALGGRMKKNLAGLFGGLNIEPVLAGLRTLIDLFDQNTATGKAMKAVFEGVFQPIIDHAQEAAWAVEAFALGLGIGMLKAYRAVKPAVKAITKALDIDTSEFDLEATLAGVSKAAETLVPPLLAFAGVATVVAAAIGTLAVVLGALPFAVITAVGLGTVAVFNALWSAAKSVGSTLSGLASSVSGALSNAFSAAKTAVSAFVGGVATLGGDIISGIVSGITAGASKVAGALTSAVSGAVDAAKSALGIASPSTVAAAEIAEPVVAGTEGALDRGAKRVQRALIDMVAPPDVSTSAVAPLNIPALVSPLQTLPALAPANASQSFAGGAPGQASASAGASGASVDLRGASIAFHGLADAPSGVQQFAEMLTRALEGDVIAVGAG